MSTIRTETVPQTWNDDIDTAFFAITSRLFSPAFTYGAGVLLASFDTDETGAEAGADTGTSAPFASSTTTGAPVDLVAVAVRRTR